MRFQKLPENLSIVVMAILFSALFVMTNIFDWDFFLTTIEVDLRSWVLDLKAPSWSYQFCAGSTREGDPQSYGLSPLIIIPVLFGSFWGSKVLLMLAVLTGVVYLKKIIQLVAPKLSNTFINLLIFSFLFNNFFFFHFSNGHLSFSSLFYAFPLLYLVLKVCLRHSFTIRDLGLNSLFLFLLLSGPFYQASIYFLLPLALALVLYIIFDYKLLREKFFWYMVGSSLLPLLLSFYRWIPVMKYQKLFPRSIDTLEWSHLHHVFFSFLAPIQGRDFLWQIPHNAQFGSAENSFFGAIPFAILFFLVMYFKKFSQIIISLDGYVKIGLSLIVVGVVLSLGNFYPFMPFALVNSVFNNSIRVIGRFNFVTYLGLFVLLLRILREIQLPEMRRKFFAGMCIFLSVSCGIQHYSWEEIKLSFLNTSLILNVDPDYSQQMQTLHVGRSRDTKLSYMYIPTLLGFSVPSCYQPMSRMVYLMDEKFMENNDKFSFHFMQSETQVRACLENSYFTQSEIYIDPSCEKGSRVHLNFIKNSELLKYLILPTEKGYILER